jgi:hypothetical protein
MEKIATVGLDIAKSVFQVHGVDASGEVAVRKRLSRARVIPYSRSCHAVLWVSKRAAHRIIGAVS